MVKVKIPCTSGNLGSGFDAIGMAFNLYNYVTMETAASGLSIQISGEGAGEIPRDEANIVWQAANLVFGQVGFAVPGLRIILENHIPVASGLGSSATSIVGGMFAANLLCGEKLSREEMMELAVSMEGHTDNVAPAIFGGAVVAVQAGEKIDYLQIPPPGKLLAVAVVPDFPLSTKKSRLVLPEMVTLQDAVFNLGRAGLLVAALLQNDLTLLGRGMEDRLHQPYRAALIPGMAEVFAAARSAGALSVAISGAGPTIIAFMAEGHQAAVGEAMAAAFRQAGTSSRIFDLQPENQGVRRC